MEFKEKIDFIFGNREKFDDPFDPPSTLTIHEKVISKSKKIMESCGDHVPLILVHTTDGLVPAIIEFPNSEHEKVSYCDEMKKMLSAFEANGYSIILSGWCVIYNEHAQKDMFFDARPSLHPNKKEILQIITEDDCNFRRTTTFDVIKRSIKGEEKTKLIQRKDFEEYGGRLSGLLERKTQH